MKPFLFTTLSVAFFTLGFGRSAALATHPDTRSAVENLRQRIEALETVLAEQSAEEPAAIPLAAGKYLTLGGLLELEAGYTDFDGEESGSDLTLATAELSLDVAVNEQVGTHLILLYEEDQGDDTMNVDEAVIILHYPRPFLGQTVAFYGGKLYLPFGKFNSSMVSDPLTLELGETADTAAVFGLEGGLWNLSLGIFNGGTDALRDDDHIDSLVASLELAPLENLHVDPETDPDSDTLTAQLAVGFYTLNSLQGGSP